MKVLNSLLILYVCAVVSHGQVEYRNFTDNKGGIDPVLLQNTINDIYHRMYYHFHNSTDSKRISIDTIDDGASYEKLEVNYINQPVRTTDSPTFHKVTMTDIAVSSGIYIHRVGDPSAADISSTTIVAGWHDWDASRICGTAAKALLLNVYIVDDTVGSTFVVAKDGDNNGYNAGVFRTQVVDAPYQGTMVVGCANGKIQFQGEYAWTSVTIIVMGWWE